MNKWVLGVLIEINRDKVIVTLGLLFPYISFIFMRKLYSLLRNSPILTLVVPTPQRELYYD